jgi:hypothetical protein
MAMGREKMGVLESRKQGRFKGEERVAADEGRVESLGGGGKGGEQQLIRVPPYGYSVTGTEYTGRHGTCSSTWDLIFIQIEILLLFRRLVILSMFSITSQIIYTIFPYQSWSSIAIENFTGIFPAV